MTPFTLTKTAAILCLFITAILSIVGMLYVARLDEYRETAETRAEIEKAMVRYYYQRIAVEQKADKAEKQRARDYMRAVKMPVSEFGLPYQEFIIKAREGK